MIDWKKVIREAGGDPFPWESYIYNLDSSNAIRVLARAQKEVGEDRPFDIPTKVLASLLPDRSGYRPRPAEPFVCGVFLDQLVRDHVLAPTEDGLYVYLGSDKPACPAVTPQEYQEYLSRPDFPPHVLGLAKTLSDAYRTRDQKPGDLIAIAADALEEADYVHLAAHLRRRDVFHGGVKKRGCWFVYLLQGRFREEFDLRRPVAASWFGLSETGFVKLAAAHGIAASQESLYGPSYDARAVLDLLTKAHNDPSVLDFVKRHKLRGKRS
jgi:hypothetical protein